MNGRSFQTLIQLTPGVVLTANNGYDTGQFSVNGQRAVSNYWMVDGVGANIGISTLATPGNGLGGSLGGTSVFGGTNSLVSVDALQEFRIQTSTYAPEFGRTPGAQISIITRSGNNRYHGTLFDYLRNDILDANDWFADNARLRKPEERQNDLGGTFSGPLFKNRTFYFFSYEGLRLRLPQTALTDVPDLTARHNASNPQMEPYLNAFPLPNGPKALDTQGNPIPGASEFNTTFSNPGSLDAFSLRIDHRLNDKVTIFGRYGYSPSKIDQRGSGASLSQVDPTKVTVQMATLGTTWDISPALVNDFRFNYSTATSSSNSRLDGFGGAAPVSALPFPSTFTNQNARLSLVILSLGQHGLLQTGVSGRNEQQQINTVNTISGQHGSHALKFGVDFRRLTPTFGGLRYVQEPLFLNISDAKAGNPFFTFLISKKNTQFLFRNLALFAQDTWRVTNRLTLTYGFRWDVDFAPSSISGPNFYGVTGFNLSNLSDLALASAGTPPYATPYRNIAPRLGLAYQLSRRQGRETVLRGGFGVFYDLATSEAGNLAFGTDYPFGGENILPGPPLGGAATYPLSATNATPPTIVPPASGSGTILGFNPTLRLPYTLEWNLAFEQALGKEQTLSLSYIGSAGRRLIQTAYVSNPNPNAAFAQLVTNAATSEYNALQAQFQRRLSRGLQAVSSYTWSHSIDTASGGSLGDSAANALTSLSRNLNRGSSDFDIRNALSLGFTYDLQIPKFNPVADKVLQGWSTDTIFQVRSAPPVNIFYDPNTFAGYIGGFNTAVRPDIVPNQPLYSYGSQYPGGKVINPNAFAAPVAFPSSQGDLSRNALRAFSAAQWDFAVHRDLPIRESMKVQFRAEMFNVVNHPNFGPPVGNLGTPTALNPQFGRSTQMFGQSLGGPYGLGSGGFDPLYQIGGPRSFQLALKLFF
jgi:hypothetical protein